MWFTAVKYWLKKHWSRHFASFDSRYAPCWLCAAIVCYCHMTVYLRLVDIFSSIIEKVPRPAHLELPDTICLNRTQRKPCVHSQPHYIPLPSPFPNPSPTVTLRHSRWFLQVKRSQGELHWFLCITASCSQPRFHWEAVGETSRAFCLLCSDCFLPEWKKTWPLCGWVRCCCQLAVIWLPVWGKSCRINESIMDSLCMAR